MLWRPALLTPRCLWKNNFTEEVLFQKPGGFLFLTTEEILSLHHDEGLKAQRLNMSALEIVDRARRQDLFQVLGPETPEMSPETRRAFSRMEAAFDQLLEQAHVGHIPSHCLNLVDLYLKLTEKQLLSSFNLLPSIHDKLELHFHMTLGKAKEMYNFPCRPGSLPTQAEAELEGGGGSASSSQESSEELQKLLEGAGYK